MINHKLLLMIPAFIFTLTAQGYDAEDGNITVTGGPFVYKTLFRDTDAGAKFQSRFGIRIAVYQPSLAFRKSGVGPQN